MPIICNMVDRRRVVLGISGIAALSGCTDNGEEREGREDELSEGREDDLIETYEDFALALGYRDSERIEELIASGSPISDELADTEPPSDDISVDIERVDITDLSDEVATVEGDFSVTEGQELYELYFKIELHIESEQWKVYDIIETDSTEIDTSLRGDISVEIRSTGTGDGENTLATFEYEYTGNSPLAVAIMGDSPNHRATIAGIPPGTEDSFQVEGETSAPSNAYLWLAATEEYQPPDPDPSLPQLRLDNGEFVMDTEQVASEAGLDGEIRDVSINTSAMSLSDSNVIVQGLGRSDFYTKSNDMIAVDASESRGLGSSSLINNATYELNVDTAAESATVEITRPPIEGEIEINGVTLDDTSEYAYVDSISLNTDIPSEQLESLNHQLIIAESHTESTLWENWRDYPAGNFEAVPDDKNYALDITEITEDGDHVIDIGDISSEYSQYINEIEFPFESEEIVAMITTQRLPLDVERATVTPDDL